MPGKSDVLAAAGRRRPQDPAVLVAARKSGVERIFKVGGAQAVAAMAYGTESVPKCDKIFGPGNAYVTAAGEYCRRRVLTEPRWTCRLERARSW